MVAVLRQRAAAYSCYVAGDYQAYADGMARAGTWGDHLTLQVRARGRAWCGGVCA